MGEGYRYKCKKCGEEFSICVGIGMLAPLEFDNTIEEIKNGIWGEEYKKLLESDLIIAPDIEEELYVCKYCGSWKTEKNMNIYAANSTKKIKRKDGKIPFAMRFDFQENYHLIKRRVHKCECGKRMHKATEEMDYLRCPKCGSESERDVDILWD